MPDNQALYLIPTSEVTLTNFGGRHGRAEAELPIKLTAHTPVLPLGSRQLPAVTRAA